ncbi:MAG: hypothetical protein MMC33_008627 [Icmadophila ericetorum]|nr:hypothetical protein [Icmadophila ericetorum]
MSSITLKISSLLIRTLSKPIANRIKQQAREHERFRRVCIAFAQRLHRLDMSLRLGLLQDPASIERQIAREAAEAQAKKHKLEAPTVKTEEETKADGEELRKLKKEVKEKVKATGSVKHKIRPLSEAKAIDSGANFISETFLFAVGLGLIIFEGWRSRRKEATRRSDVADQIASLEASERAARQGLIELEKEVIRLREKEGKGTSTPRRHIIPKEILEMENINDDDDEPKESGWFTWIKSFGRKSEPVPVPETMTTKSPVSSPTPEKTDTAVTTKKPSNNTPSSAESASTPNHPSHPPPKAEGKAAGKEDSQTRKT